MTELGTQDTGRRQTQHKNKTKENKQNTTQKTKRTNNTDPNTSTGEGRRWSMLS